MVDIEELKRRFKVANVAGRGRCIIIPVDKFDSKWDQELLDQGVESHADEGYVYVSLGPEAVESTVRYGQWSEDEDKKLVELWDRDLKIDEIAEHFPARTRNSVKSRLARLKKAGKIKPRYKRKTHAPRSTEKPEKKKKEKRKEKKPSGIVPPESSEGILEVLAEHTKVLDKLNCQVLMQALEIKQLKGELIIPPNLLIHYANALLEDDNRYRDVFRSKVKGLMEASK